LVLVSARTLQQNKCLYLWFYVRTLGEQAEFAQAAQAVLSDCPAALAVPGRRS